MLNGSITIKDIAEKAGVSVSTVSKVLNNYTDISEKTREKVNTACRELNFTSDLNSRSQQKKESMRIGLIIEDYKKNGVSEAFTLEILMGFKQYLLENGFEVILLSTSTPEQKEVSLAKLVTANNLRGIFYLGMKLSDPYYDEVKKEDFPCVLFDIPLGRERAGNVGVDNLKGAMLATEHLLESGHRKIAFVNGYKDAYVSAERLNGYFLALNKYDVSINRDIIQEADFTEEGAKKAIEGILKRDASITAVFAASDLMAAGIIKYLNSIGKKVPEDISVIGFDDIEIASHITPGLTTIRQERFEIGMSAATLLVNLINGQKMHSILVEPRLVIRGSTSNI